MDFQAILQTVLAWLVVHGLRVILIIVLAFIARKLASILANKFFSFLRRDEMDVEMQKRTDTLSSIIRYVLHVGIWAVALVLVLSELGIAIGPILAAAGIVGLAVGFGAQNLVQDVISGFFILLEDQIRVGDVVQLEGKGGVVEKVNLRMTILRDLSGNVHYVRNGMIGIVTNMTKGFSYYLFDIGVAYREDTDEVVALVKQVDEQIRAKAAFKDDILEPIEILGLDQFADSAIIIKARIKTKPIKQWRVGREFNRLLKKKFDEQNIEIPFPHVTVYMGENKEGQAPPLHVTTDKKEIG